MKKEKLFFIHSGYTEPRPETNKPKPIIQKITFTPKEQEEIKTLLEGKPNKYTKGRAPARPDYLKKKLKQEYYKGICGLCGELPEYRVLYDMGNAILKENYCQKHFKQYFHNELA